MKKLKTQDLLVYGGVGAIGIAVIFVFFFSNLIVTWDASSSVDANQGSGIPSSNGFNKINTNVPTEPVQDFSNKIDIYDDELEKKEEEKNLLAQTEYNKEQAQNSQTKVNDLSSFLEDEKSEQKTTPTIKAESKDDQAQTIQKKTSNAKTQTSKPLLVTKEVRENKTSARKEIKQVDSPALKETEQKRKPRRTDPTFGEESTISKGPIPTDQATTTISGPGSFYSAKIMGDQVLKEGSRVTVRLTQDVKVGNCPLLRNSILTGLATMTTQRILVRFTACQKERAVTYFSLYDVTDSNEGLYIETFNTGQEAGRDVAGAAVGETARQLGVPIVDNVVRNSTSKKINTLTVKVDDAKEVFLKIYTPN
jgi:hypothetical protein